MLISACPVSLEHDTDLDRKSYKTKGNLCTCANSISDDAQNQAPSSCLAPCPGSPSEACGSSTCTQVYVIAGGAVTSSSSSSILAITTSSTSGPGSPSTSLPATTPSSAPATSTTVPPPSNIYPPAIILQAFREGNNDRKISRRQSSGGFVSTGGTSTGCSGGTSYVLNGGMLYANGALVSTNPGVPYQLFGPLTPDGTITGDFSLTQDGNLTWANGNFTNGVASFCLDGNGFLNAVFDGAPPSGCDPTNVRAFSGQYFQRDHYVR